MNRIDHILVVVDPSASGPQSAVDKASVLARGLDASVELLICEIRSERDNDAAALQTKTHPANTRLLNLLDGLAAPMRLQGLQVTVRIIDGSFLHDSLLDFLRGSNADLVVKDTHPHSFAKRPFLRSTDWHLARGCPIPLLLTKRKQWAQRPIIMAAVDPNHTNERAAALDRHILYCAVSLAGRLAGELHVIHSYVPTAFAAIVAGGTLSMTREYSEALQVENSFRCCQIEGLVSAYGVTQEHLHVEMGTPGDCLTDSVRKYHADVMVMGASSHGRWHRMVVGSTASTVLEQLPCDILIVSPSDHWQAIPL